MSTFSYKTLDENGKESQGTIEAVNEDIAISGLQRRGLTVLEIKGAKEGSLLNMRLTMFERVTNKEVVILSRQIATLFSAQVSALKIFKLLGSESENPKLKDALASIADELQAGSSLADAMQKQPDIFSKFYVSMVRAGEESGKLQETFMSLADYLERMYELLSKAKGALIYPAFVILTFFGVMALMLTVVIPKLASIITESGQEIPIYTKIVIALSDFMVNYGIFFLVLLILGGIFLFRFSKKPKGRFFFSKLKISLPFLGNLYMKLYLSRLADNMHTMLGSGIPMVRAIEITAEVVNNQVFENLLREVAEDIKGGRQISESLRVHEEIPSIMVQMVKVGEETGELGTILKTLSDFYRREVNTAVDALVDLIEPAMMVTLGLGVGVLLASVLMPIYNLSSGI